MIRNTVLLLSGLLMVAAVGITAPAVAETASEEIDKRAKNPDWWPAPGRDNKLTRHSNLKDINLDNVAKLKYVWSQSTGALRGHEGQPVVVEHDGKPMMFFSSGCPNMAQCNIVQALDLTDPDNPIQVWNYVKKTDRDELAVPRACCDTVHRGVNYAKNKVIYHTLDGFVIALDASTGKEVWVVKHAYPEKGETITGPTLIAENLVIAGFGGDEFAARGRLTAYDVDTGKVVWNCHSTGPDKDVCLTPDTNKANPHLRHGRHQDIGVTSYPDDERRRVEDRRRLLLGLGQLRSRAQACLLVDRQPRSLEPQLSLRRQDPRRVQHRQVGQQVVDDHFRPQGRHRRGRLGLSDDAVRPVGL